MELFFEDWGSIDFSEALAQQESLVEAVRDKLRSPTVIFCSHPPLVTKGRSTLEGDITDWSGPIYEINRGGRATYHGPSQIMIYPIIPLAITAANSERRPSDVGSFLRQFELAIVDVLKDLGIPAQGKSYQPHFKTQNPIASKAPSPIFSPIATSSSSLSQDGSSLSSQDKHSSLSFSENNPSEKNEETGVWVGNKKIASLGLSIRQWVSFHGAALNVFFDTQAFQGLKPCGFHPSVMTSIEEILGISPDAEWIKERLKLRLQERL